MTPADAAELLTIAAAFDRRKIGRADAIAWADALRDLDPVDCGEAIREHFRESTDYLMPAHVRQGVRRIRAERIRAADSSLIEPADVDKDDVPAYLAAIRARRAALGSGQVLEREPLHPRHDVIDLVQRTAAALPAMPPAFPRNDGRNALSPSQPGTQRRPQ